MERKILCKNGFSFSSLVFGSIKKMSQRKTIFSQHKEFDLFLKIFSINFFFKKTILSHSKLNKGN